MLSILINNESIKKAYKKSQRILSKYLLQLGQRTYCGSISKEGLENLEKDLKAISSRYMSISCLSIKNKHTHELLWIIGNKDNFDQESGIFAMKTKIIKEDTLDFIENNTEKYFNSLIKISALFHDLGKANDDFQNKLLKVVENHQNGTKINSYDNTEFFRHETVSVFMVHFFFIEFKDKLSKNEVINESIIEECFNYSLNEINLLLKNDFDITKYNFENLLEKILNEIKKLNIQKKGNATQKKLKFNIKNENNVVEEEIDLFEITKLSIMWLVLTHHKLIGLKKLDDNKLSYESYFNFDKNNSPFINNFEFLVGEELEKFEKIKNDKLKDNLTFSKSLPSKDQFWKKSVYKELTELIDLFVINELKKDICGDSFSVSNYLSILTHYCRPFLVFSDYLGSVIKTKKDEDKTYINKYHTIENFANLDGKELGDTLNSHLNIVKKSVRKSSHLFKICKNKHDNNYFSFLSKNETKVLNKKIESSSPSKFEWQNIAYNKILQSNQSNCFSFSVIISETGSGKTLGGAKVMKAISNHNLRYTLALGLRTLTLQSGKSYREDLGLNDQQVAVIIGSELSQKIFEKNNVAITGSDVLDNDDDQYVVDYQSTNNKWKEILNCKNGLYESEKLFDNQSSKIIEAPIVVCTVDQLIGIVDLNKVSKAKILPRIFSSDLILDEIDNYSPTDLVHIGRLIYLYGLYGRKVIIMSATVSSIIIEQLYESYIKGINTFKYLNKINKDVKLNLISNLTSPEIINIEENKDFKIELEGFIKNFVDTQKNTNAKLKLNNVVSITADNWIKPIYNECKILHNKFRIETLIDDKKYNISIGFIKFNNVGSARNMAYELLSKSDEDLTLGENKKISVLCYHSKYTTIELDNIEIQLNKIINRKDEKSLINNEQINHIIDSNYIIKNDNIKDLTIIICTTSILEVGRDHDYDWSIIEPSTNKSVIQAAGRVLRHRNNNDPESRVSILSTMIKNKNYKKASDIWKNNGVYNYIKNTDEFENKITFDGMFGNKNYLNGIFTSIIFEKDTEDYSNTMKLLEDKSYSIYLNYNNDSKIKSLANYFGKNQWLNNYHYLYNKFRRKNTKTKQGYVKLFKNNFEKSRINDYKFEKSYYFSNNGNIWNNIDAFDFSEIKQERIFLKSYLIEDILIKYKDFTDNEINLLTMYDIEYFETNNSTKNIKDILDYHPLLGFNYKKLIQEIIMNQL